MDGRSLARLLRAGRVPGWRDYAVTFSGSAEQGNLAASVRTLRYRYAENSARDGGELIDMLVDPYERGNLVNRPAIADVQARLKALIEAERTLEFPVPLGARRSTDLPPSQHEPSEQHPC